MAVISTPPLLALYSGNSLESLTLIARNDDDQNSRTSRVEFDAIPDQTYYFAIDGFEHAVGQISLSLEQIEEVDSSPLNDDILNAFMIPSLDQVMVGSNLFATRGVGDRDDYSDILPHHSVWWSWTAGASGTVSFDTIGSSFDTVLSIYQGVDSSSLTLVSENDDYFGSSSLAWFQAVGGQKYFISVDGKGVTPLATISGSKEKNLTSPRLP